jgi:hypothetical protein
MPVILDRTVESLKRSNLEAEVLIVCISEDSSIFRIIPFWECSMTPADLTVASITEAALFAEFIGAGTVSSFIIDLRD